MYLKKDITTKKYRDISSPGKQLVLHYRHWKCQDTILSSRTVVFAQLPFGISFICISVASGSSVMVMFIIISWHSSLIDRAWNNWSCSHVTLGERAKHKKEA